MHRQKNSWVQLHSASLFWFLFSFPPFPQTHPSHHCLCLLALFSWGVPPNNLLLGLLIGWLFVKGRSHVRVVWELPSYIPALSCWGVFSLQLRVEYEVRVFTSSTAAALVHVQRRKDTPELIFLFICITRQTRSLVVKKFKFLSIFVFPSLLSRAEFLTGQKRLIFITTVSLWRPQFAKSHCKVTTTSALWTCSEPERECAHPCQIGPPPHWVCVPEEANARASVDGARGGWVRLWRLRPRRPWKRRRSRSSRTNCSSSSATWRKGWCLSPLCTRWGGIPASCASANRPSASPSYHESTSSTRVYLLPWGSLPLSTEVKQKTFFWYIYFLASLLPALPKCCLLCTVSCRYQTNPQGLLQLQFKSV